MRVTAGSTINLLPWRDLERARRTRAMVGAMVGAVLAGVLVVTAVGWYLQRCVEVQERRNLLLERETAALESRVEEAQGWRTRQEQLLRRIGVVERLRNSRPGTVRVFDALVNTLVEGAHYGRIERRGQFLEVEGLAASNRLVSALMRNLESSSQFTAAQLKRLYEDPRGDAYGSQGSSFEMTLLQVLPVAQHAADGQG